ncbi:uncharacterized protein LOC103875299 [Brassica rapa]|uniref:uncharacterized protein LOC117129744 n=1 Tax=Brassica campestris TaxID=3711 RepID=UPI00142DCF0A|nr:uncharacterized protein LOC117129744 [Brassica rapa]XP_033138952.1 uncharacterized protein LOC103875299 [Brassica rapa]
MTRPPMTSGGRSYGTGPTTQPSGSQAAGAQRHVANHEPVENREEVAHVPVQRDVRVLHPARQNGAKWFKNNTEVSTCVRKIIEGCFRGPWYSWKKVPPFYKDAWFSTFQTKFEWDASIGNLVKENFDQLAATRLKGMVSLAKSNGEKPDWILSDYWRVMSEYWRTSKAKDKSEKARASRLSRRDGLGVHRHRAGSRSYAKVQDVLEANNEDSSFIAVLKKTHQKSDGTYVDERARLIAEKFDECVQERLSEMENSSGEDLTIDNLTLEEKNEIYSKIVGTSKQGRVFGLGSLQRGVLMPLESSTGSPLGSADVGTITHRVGELEAELQKSHDEYEDLKKRIEAVEAFCFNTN